MIEWTLFMARWNDKKASNYMFNFSRLQANKWPINNNNLASRLIIILH